MPLNQEAQDEIREKIKEYILSLDSSTWIEDESIFSWIKRGRKIYGTKNAMTWDSFLETIEKYSDGRLGEDFLKHIDQHIKSKFTHAITKTDIDRVVEEFLEQINYAYDRKFLVYVPLSNINLGHDVDRIPLANCILRRGHAFSDFAEAVDNSDNWVVFPTDKKENKELCFLEMIVYGDNEHIRAQAMLNVDDALKVLRFVSWTNTDPKKPIEADRMNSGHEKYVAPFPFPDTYGFYAKTQLDSSLKGQFWGGHLSNIFPHRINSAEFEWMEKFGLNDINALFKNQSTVAEHIRVALDWYDNAQKALRYREAVSYYVVCVNGLLSWDTGTISDVKKLKKRLFALLYETLYKGIFDFYMPTSFQESSDEQRFELFFKAVVDTYTKLYNHYRGKFLHGLATTSSKPHLTSLDIKIAETIAFNVLRIIAGLVYLKQFQNKQDFENWFEAKSRQHERILEDL
jgi:hypothetical protein